jgi:hypothetical protein
MPLAAIAANRDWPDQDIAPACFYPAHSGGRTWDGQDARLCGAVGGMVWIEIPGRGEIPAGGWSKI